MLFIIFLSITLHNLKRAGKRRRLLIPPSASVCGRGSLARQPRAGQANVKCVVQRCGLTSDRKAATRPPAHDPSQSQYMWTFKMDAPRIRSRTCDAEHSRAFALWRAFFFRDSPGNQNQTKNMKNTTRASTIIKWPKTRSRLSRCGVVRLQQKVAWTFQKCTCSCFRAHPPCPHQHSRPSSALSSTPSKLR